MNNILFCSAGRRNILLRDAKTSLVGKGQVFATDVSPVAPALFDADKAFLVPRIDSADYNETILRLCKENDVKAITTLIDPEIEILAAHRDKLLAEGILPLCPSKETARLCFNKYEMFRHLSSHHVRTVLTYDSLNSFKEGLDKGEISFPVFMKPISGSGSVGIGKVNNWDEAVEKFNDGQFTYIIQELMTGGDCDADVYVDCYTHKPVSIFSKRKIESRIGGASKTISFKDPKLFAFVEEVCSVLELNGPCDMDFFGAYLHAYGAGVDFFKFIINNIQGKQNLPDIGNYDEDVIMMMYDAVVITKKNQLLSDHFDLL